MISMSRCAVSPALPAQAKPGAQLTVPRGSSRGSWVATQTRRTDLIAPRPDPGAAVCDADRRSCRDASRIQNLLHPRVFTPEDWPRTASARAAQRLEPHTTRTGREATGTRAGSLQGRASQDNMRPCVLPPSIVARSCRKGR
jgi:hypothetical protein